MEAQHPTPDPRPLPDGWVQQYEPSKNIWYYIQVGSTPPQVSFIHPADQAPPYAAADVKQTNEKQKSGFVDQPPAAQPPYAPIAGPSSEPGKAPIVDQRPPAAPVMNTAPVPSTSRNSLPPGAARPNPPAVWSAPPAPQPANLSKAQRLYASSGNTSAVLTTPGLNGGQAGQRQSSQNTTQNRPGSTGSNRASTYIPPTTGYRSTDPSVSGRPTSTVLNQEPRPTAPHAYSDQPSLHQRSATASSAYAPPNSSQFAPANTPRSASLIQTVAKPPLPSHPAISASGFVTSPTAIAPPTALSTSPTYGSLASMPQPQPPSNSPPSTVASGNSFSSNVPLPGAATTATTHSPPASSALFVSNPSPPVSPPGSTTAPSGSFGPLATSSVSPLRPPSVAASTLTSNSVASQVGSTPATTGSGILSVQHTKPLAPPQKRPSGFSKFVHGLAGLPAGVGQQPQPPRPVQQAAPGVQSSLYPGSVGSTNPTQAQPSPNVPTSLSSPPTQFQNSSAVSPPTNLSTQPSLVTTLPTQGLPQDAQQLIAFYQQLLVQQQQEHQQLIVHMQQQFTLQEQKGQQLLQLLVLQLQSQSQQQLPQFQQQHQQPQFQQGQPQFQQQQPPQFQQQQPPQFQQQPPMSPQNYAAVPAPAPQPQAQPANSGGGTNIFDTLNQFISSQSGGGNSNSTQSETNINIDLNYDASALTGMGDTGGGDPSGGSTGMLSNFFNSMTQSGVDPSAIGDTSGSGGALGSFFSNLAADPSSITGGLDLSSIDLSSLALSEG